MKKLLFLIAVLFYSMDIFAVGSCSQVTNDSYLGSTERWITYACVGDASTGAIPDLTVTGFKGYYLYTVETWAGAVAPTDDSDYTMLDDASIPEDLMGGNGTDGIDATTKKTAIPKSTFMGLNIYHMVKGNLKIVTTNNSVKSAVIYYRITGGK